MNKQHSGNEEQQVTSFVERRETQVLRLAYAFLSFFAVLLLLLLAEIHTIQALSLYSLADRALALAAVAAGAAVLAWASSRNAGERVEYDGAEIRLYKGGTLINGIVVEGIASLELGNLYSRPGRREARPGIQFILKDGEAFVIPASLVEEGSRRPVLESLREELADIPAEGRLYASSTFGSKTAIFLFITLIALLASAVISGSKGDVLAAFRAEGATVFNRSDYTRGLRITALAPVDSSLVAVGTERQGVWLFRPPQRWRHSGVAEGYVAALTVKDGQTAVAVAGSRAESLATSLVKVIDTATGRSRDLAQVNARVNGMVYNGDVLYITTDQGVFMIPPEGAASRIGGLAWSGYPSVGPDGKVYLTEADKGRFTILALSEGKAQVALRGEGVYPFVAFDDKGRLWNISPDGTVVRGVRTRRILGKVPALVLETVGGGRRIWLRTAGAENGGTGLGFIDTASPKLSFTEVIAPSRTGGPKAPAFGGGALWVAGQGY